MSLANLDWDSWHELVNRMADFKSEWAGIPSPIKGLPLRVEDKYPYKGIETIGREEVELSSEWQVVNRWFSQRLRGNVLIGRSDKTGKSAHFLEPYSAVDMMLGTMIASQAWPIKAERRALDKLAELIPNHLFVAYLTTGAFIETSPRSRITYVFRKLRPTIALKAGPDDKMRILSTLCLHPIAYYEGTWAGSMVPTDDVIAHLCLMRGDEHLFWKRSNQHPAIMPQSGL